MQYFFTFFVLKWHINNINIKAKGGEKIVLRTVTLNLKELNDYGLNLNILSNNLYNRTTYIIRQMMTGFQKKSHTKRRRSFKTSKRIRIKI